MSDDARLQQLRRMAEAEQAAAALGMTAALLGQYFTELRAAGFDEPSAMLLVMQYHQMLLNAAFRPHRD